jgi:hypothetical protein
MSFDIGDHEKTLNNSPGKFSKNVRTAKTKSSEVRLKLIYEKKPEAKNLVTLYIFFQVVQEYERAVIFRLGRLRKVIRLKIWAN